MPLRSVSTSPAPSRLEATLRKDNETLRKEIAALKLTSGSADGMQMVPVSGGGEATSDTASAVDQPVIGPWFADHQLWFETQLRHQRVALAEM